MQELPVATPITTIFSFPPSLRRSPDAFTAELNRSAVIAGKYIARRRRLLPTFEIRGLPRQVSKHSPSPVLEILGDATGKPNLVAGPDPGPRKAFSTDFTELSYVGGNRKTYLMAAVRLESKYVPGWAVGASANRKITMRCWEQVRERLTGLGEGIDRKIIHHD